MHTLALNHLADLPFPVVDRIVLYKQCSVQIDRLLPLYAELCLREEPLALEESVRLGYELTVAITHVREPLLRAKARAVDDDTQGPDMNPIIEGPAISTEQVIKLVNSALETTEASSSVMDLQKPHKCPTSHPSACDQSHNHVSFTILSFPAVIDPTRFFFAQHKPNLRVRYNKQATTSTLGDVMTAESSTQGKNRSIPSSSKGKAPGESDNPPPNYQLVQYTYF
jgi:hypothetical protein